MQRSDDNFFIWNTWDHIYTRNFTTTSEEALTIDFPKTSEDWPRVSKMFRRFQMFLGILPSEVERSRHLSVFFMTRSRFSFTLKWFIWGSQPQICSPRYQRIFLSLGGKLRFGGRRPSPQAAEPNYTETTNRAWKASGTHAGYKFVSYAWDNCSVSGKCHEIEVLDPGGVLPKGKGYLY